jgi:heat shock protein 1/8
VQRIVDWLANQFKAAEGVDLLKDAQALQRLTESVEKAKIELSSLTHTSIRYMAISLRALCVC